MKKLLQVSNGQFVARVYHDIEWNEYRVKFYRVSGEYMGEGVDCFEDTKADAMDSARYTLAGLSARESSEVLI